MDPLQKRLTWLQIGLSLVLAVALIGLAIYFILVQPSVQGIFGSNIGDSYCGWYGAAQTWVDTNGNGIYEAGEPPLPGVRVEVYAENEAGQQDEGEGLSDEDGYADMNLTFDGQCRSWENVQAHIRVEAPPGYELTTPDIVDFEPEAESAFEHSYEDARENPAASFGFMVGK